VLRLSLQGVDPHISTVLLSDILEVKVFYVLWTEHATEGITHTSYPALSLNLLAVDPFLTVTTRFHRIQYYLQINGDEKVINCLIT
jgi:hypothetical protein